MSERATEAVAGRHHGSEMNGAAVLVTERRLLHLEWGMVDLTRRVVIVESAQSASLMSDHQRDRDYEKLSERQANWIAYLTKELLPRLQRMEAAQMRLTIGTAMLVASGAVQGAKAVGLF